MNSLPNWAWMWLIAVIIFVFCKMGSWQRMGAETKKVSFGRMLAYFFAWPGMDPKTFCDVSEKPKKPTTREWAFAWAKTVFGATLYWVIPHVFFSHSPMLFGWSGMLGLIFLLHFGTFHLIALFWQNKGISAQPIMQAPLQTTSLSEFWGSRWNLGFRQLSYDFVYAPMRKSYSIISAMLASFFVSGLIHELVISIPAHAGYGLPTLYFMIQGSGILLERSNFGAKLGLGKGKIGKIFALFFAGVPVFWLFHPPFVMRVIVPFMQATSFLN